MIWRNSAALVPAYFLRNAGTFSAREKRREQIAKDKWLIENEQWEIEWDFKMPKGKKLSKPLRDLLEQAGIKITIEYTGV